MFTHLRFKKVLIRLAQNDEVCWPTNHDKAPVPLTEAKQYEAYFSSIRLGSGLIKSKPEDYGCCDAYA
ncbi:hypothetical protein D9M69_655650 [compost metagenome]